MLHVLSSEAAGMSLGSTQHTSSFATQQSFTLGMHFHNPELSYAQQILGRIMVYIIDQWRNHPEYHKMASLTCDAFVMWQALYPVMLNIVVELLLLLRCKFS